MMNLLFAKLLDLLNPDSALDFVMREYQTFQRQTGKIVVMHKKAVKESHKKWLYRPEPQTTACGYDRQKQI